MKRTVWKIFSLCFLCTVIFSLAFSDPALAASDPELTCTYLKGSNVNRQNYSRWTSTVKSYLTKKGTQYMRVQAGATGSWVSVSYYDEDFKLLQRKEVDTELPIFGGFYETDSNYFIVSGQENTDESDDVEVYRITKYDKDWNRIADCSLKGANTYIPFDAGSCRMDASGSYLVIRTCHEMYQDSNGNHHQSNVTIQVNMDSMEVTDSYTKIMNTAYGYVSHSFNQFIKVDNDHIVSVDHGDGHPRAIALMTYPKSVSSGEFTPTSSSPVNMTKVLSFPGESGDNTTGASVGGFEVSDSSYLIAGNAVAMDDSFANYSTRNVFVAAVDKSSKAVNINYLTDYAEGSTTSYTPQLVKINQNKYLVLWTRGSDLFYTFVNGNGEKLTDIYTKPGQLSDCHPYLDGDKVIWYTWNNDVEKFYQIPVSQPEDLSVTETSYDHDFEYLKTENGVAYFKCKKCGAEREGRVPTAFTMYWNTTGTGYYYSFLPNPMETGSTLYSMISNITYSAEKDYTYSGFIMELDDPEAGEIKYDGADPYVTWKKAGQYKIKVYPKYNPTLVKKYSITVVKPLESLALTADKESGQTYGSTINFTATAQGGKGTLQYQFSSVDDDGNATVLKDYSEENTFSWTPDAAGKYHILAKVQDSGDEDSDGNYKVVSSNTIDFEIIKAKVKLSDGSSVLKDGKLIYGQTISDLALSDAVNNNTAFENTDTGAKVAGTISFDNPDQKPAAGTSSVSWTFTPDDTNYEALKGTCQVTVAKADPTISELPVTDDIIYHPSTKLNDIALNGGKTDVEGSWTWADKTIIPTVTQKTYKVVFTPDDTDNYNTIEKDITLSVSKATPVLDPDSVKANDISYGQTLADSGLTGKATLDDAGHSIVPGSFAWVNKDTKPNVSDSGKTTYDIIFTPEDTANYNTAEGKTSLIVKKAAVRQAVSDILESNQLSYGQTISDLPLSGAVKNNTAFENASTGEKLSGTLSFDEPDKQPEIGPSTVSWTFVPDDDNYESITGSSEIEVIKAAPKISDLPTADAISYNPSRTLAEVTLKGGQANVDGKWTWADETIVPTVARKTYKVIFTPDDTKNYNTVEKEISLSVAKAKTKILTASAEGITYGQPLGDAKLSGSAAAIYDGSQTGPVNGSITWANNDIKPPVADNDKTLFTIIFTPEDSSNYSPSDKQITLTVKAAELEKVPSGTMTVDYSAARLSNDLLKDYPDWSFVSSYIGKEIPVSETGQIYGVEYTADDAENYSNNISSITIIRKPCSHESIEVRNKKAATCTEKGYSGDTYCKTCNTLLKKGQETAALGHSFGKWTYADKNNHKRICSHDKNHVETAAHSWDGGKITKAATTKAAGVRTYTCNVCGGTKTETIPKLPATTAKKAATTTAKKAASTTADQTAVGPAPTVKSAEKKITKLSDNGEAKNSTFNLLQAKAKKIGRNYIKLQWTKVKGASSYIIYGNKCGTGYRYRKIATVSSRKTKYTVTRLPSSNRKIKKGTFYKFMIVAVGKTADGTRKAIATSKTIHLITRGKKGTGNFKRVKLISKSWVTLRKGKKTRIRAKQIKSPANAKVSQHRKLCYESSNPKVATVSKKGWVTAKSKGIAKIYVYAQNGVFTVVTIRVK